LVVDRVSQLIHPGAVCLDQCLICEHARRQAVEQGALANIA
jgi:hypothetical protein